MGMLADGKVSEEEKSWKKRSEEGVEVGSVGRKKGWLAPAFGRKAKISVILNFGGLFVFGVQECH